VLAADGAGSRIRKALGIDSVDVFGQRVDSAGAPIGPEFRINTQTIGSQSLPQVAVEPDGDFVVVWDSTSGDYGLGVFGQRVDKSGALDGQEFQMNTYTSADQREPNIARRGARSYLAVWESADQDGSVEGIFGQRLTVAGATLSGKRLVISTPPSGTSNNRVVFVSKDALLLPPSDPLEDPRCPPLGSGPTVAGASIRIIGLGGDFTIDLPCQFWSANLSGSRYRYRDPAGTTCRSVIIAAGRVARAVCKGPQVAYTLGVAQDDVAVVVRTGDPSAFHKHCASTRPKSPRRTMFDVYGCPLTGFSACPVPPFVPSGLFPSAPGEMSISAGSSGVRRLEYRMTSTACSLKSSSVSTSCRSGGGPGSTEGRSTAKGDTTPTAGRRRSARCPGPESRSG
jgi:hypothetical protein